MRIDKNFRLKITRHNILCLVISMLENKKIKIVSANKYLIYILHEKVKAKLKENYNFCDKDIENLEALIFRDAENLSGYEVIKDVPHALYYDLRNQSDTDLLLDNYVVQIPNSILNAFICEELERRFSRTDILNCGCFIKKQFQDESGKFHSIIRLDLDENLNRRGFIMPNFEDDLITGLLVFRHPNDKYPFILRSRNLVQGGENGKRRILQAY